MCGIHWSSNLLLDTSKCWDSTTREISICSIFCWCNSLSRTILCLPHSSLSLRVCWKTVQQVSISDFIEGGCYMGLESHFRCMDTKLSGTYKNSCKETSKCMNMWEDFSFVAWICGWGNKNLAFTFEVILLRYPLWLILLWQ